MRSNRILSLPGFLSLIFLVTIPGLAQADFSGAYDVTPPAPGSYFVIAPGPQTFGAWTCLPSARGERVDTTGAPLNLVLDTESVTRPVAGYFFARAVDAGVVSFEYTISGKAAGTLRW